MFLPEDDSIAPVDAANVIRQTVGLAERGFWDLKLVIPSGRRLTVRQIVKLYRLEKLIEPTET